MSFGVLIRCLNYLADKSLWNDEFFTLYLGKLTYAEAFIHVVRDVHAPIYYMLARVGFDLFGVSSYGMRLIPLLASIAMIPLAYRLCTYIMDQKAALLSMFLVSLSPYYLQMANEAREYSLTGLLGLVVFMLFMAQAKRTRFAQWGFVGGMVAGLYLHHYFWPLFVVYGCCLDWFYESRKTRLKILLVTLAAGLPMLYSILWQMVISEDSFNPERVNLILQPVTMIKTLLGQILHFASGYYYSHISISELVARLPTDPFGIVYLTLTPLTLFFAIRAMLKDKEFANSDMLKFAFFGFVFLFLALTIAYPIRAKARYFASFSCFFYVFMGFGLYALSRQFWGKVLVVLFLFLNMGGVAHSLMLQTDPIHREDYKQMVRQIHPLVGPNDLVIGNRIPMQYYLTRLKLEFAADHVDDEPRKITQALNQKKYDRIFLTFYGDKEQSHNEAYKQRAISKMKEFGYTFMEEKRLGGQVGFNYLYLFESSVVN